MFSHSYSSFLNWRISVPYHTTPNSYLCIYLFMYSLPWYLFYDFKWCSKMTVKLPDFQAHRRVHLISTSTIPSEWIIFLSLNVILSWIFLYVLCKRFFIHPCLIFFPDFHKLYSNIVTLWIALTSIKSRKSLLLLIINRSVWFNAFFLSSEELNNFLNSSNSKKGF
jgi:hypothetical protein